MLSYFETQVKTAPKASFTPARSGLLQRCTATTECDDCRDKRLGLQREAIQPSSLSPARTLATGEAGRQAHPSEVPPIVHEVLGAPGQPLGAAMRTFMEPRFGYDFSQVRVHADGKAAESAEAVNARAYTVGRDIVFGPGQYAQQTETGQRLLAHELTHVIQQADHSVGTDAETKASNAANQVVGGKALAPGMVGGAPVSIQMAPKDTAPSPDADAPSPSTLRMRPTAGESSEPPIDEFDFDKTDIPAKHLDRLNELRTRLLNAPDAKVILTGHTDTVGSEKYNLDLGRRRAQAVRDFLTQKSGVASSRITVESLGETQPAAEQPAPQLDPNTGVRNPKNRRVEIRITGSLKAPGFEFDPRDPAKKPPINLKLPPDYFEKHPPKPAPDQPEKPTPTEEPKKEGGLKAEGSITLTPGKTPEKGSTRAARMVESELEVSYEESTGKRKILPKISVTLHIGPNGVEELEADLVLFKQELAKQTLGGAVKNLEVHVSFNPGFSLDKSTANRLIPDFAAKFKATLAADLGIPRTSISLPVEVSVSVDPLGRPEAEVKFTLFKF